MQKLGLNNTASEKTIGWFLLIWTVFNIVQACTLQLHPDEAYYWMYSRFLAWGYFDHPPMVALFIRPGDMLMHNELGLRLINILSSTASLYILWRIVKTYRASAVWFILIAGGMFTLHIYGFITTPDGPLLFFTVLFFYVYRHYLIQNKWWQAVVLGILVACLLYSKYHAILLVGFTIIANSKTLIKRPSFWLIVMLALVLYLPHIWWQVQNNYPSAAYHLSDRSEKSYHFDYTLAYIASQMLMAGVLTGWLLFYRGFAINNCASDAFTRCLRVNFIGITLFFLFSSVRGEVQPQWTIIALAALVILMLIFFEQNGYPPVWFKRLAIANICIIAAVRLLMVLQPPFVKNIQPVKNFFNYREWAHQIYKKIGNSPLIMNDGFQLPSKYNFYNNTTTAFAYDNRYYRLTQFEIWPLEDNLQGRRAYYLLTYPLPITTDTIQTAAGTFYGVWINSVRTYQKIAIAPQVKDITIAPGKKQTIILNISNPYSRPVNFANTPQQDNVYLEACFFKKKNQVAAQKADSSFNAIKLQPGQSTRYAFTITAPQQKGRYDLFFSIRTQPFDGSRNSGIISFTVE